MRQLMRALVCAGVAVGSALAQPDWKVGAHRFGLEEPRPKADGAVRIATYNIENLFDGVDDPVSPRDDVEWSKPEAEQRAVAEAIRRLDADVLALQEVESESVLRAFRNTYLSDMGYTHLASIDTGDERGIEQSVLSRFPIVEAKNFGQIPLGGVHPEKYGDQENWYAGEPLLFRRGPLMVRVEVPGAEGGEPYEVKLFVLHHKSGRYNDYWREAEARKMVEVIAASGARPTDNVVVLGDFNAQVGEGVLETYFAMGFRDVLGHTGEGLEPEHVTHESGRAIDHVLISPGMRGEAVQGSAFVMGTLARQEGVSWRDFPPPEGYASDHYPVAVDIRPVDVPTKE